MSGGWTEGAGEVVLTRPKKGAAAVFWAFASFALLLLVSTVHAEDAMILHLKADQSEYAFREPVKLTVELENSSQDTLEIPQLWNLGSNMEFMYLELTDPHGAREERKLEYMFIDRLGCPREVLTPGNKILTFLYPNITRNISPTTNERGYRITFDQIGVYEVRVVYAWYCMWVLTREREKLYSNPIELRLREPSEREVEILDAIWNSGERGEYRGPREAENNPSLHDEVALRRVIARFPDEPLIRHAHFGLAKSLCSNPRDLDRLEIAIPILEMLGERYPGYRYAEVQQLLGYSYLRLGKTDEAQEVFLAAMNRVPELFNNGEFMLWKLRAFDESVELFAEMRRKGEASPDMRFERQDKY